MGICLRKGRAPTKSIFSAQFIGVSEFRTWIVFLSAYGSCKIKSMYFCLNTVIMKKKNPKPTENYYCKWLLHGNAIVLIILPWSWIFCLFISWDVISLYLAFNHSWTVSWSALSELLLLHHLELLKCLIIANVYKISDFLRWTQRTHFSLYFSLMCFVSVCMFEYSSIILSIAVLWVFQCCGSLVCCFFFS